MSLVTKLDGIEEFFSFNDNLGHVSITNQL